MHSVDLIRLSMCVCVHVRGVHLLSLFSQSLQSLSWYTLSVVSVCNINFLLGPSIGCQIIHVHDNERVILIYNVIFRITLVPFMFPEEFS